MRKSLFSVGILIAASLNAASPALANDFDAIAITVATHDLDLGKKSDIARLAARLNRAAQSACAPGDMGGFAGRRAFSACKADALEAGRTKMERIVGSISGKSEALFVSRR